MSGRRRCDSCGEAYTAKRATSRFCSRKCRTAAYRGRLNAAQHGGRPLRSTPPTTPPPAAAVPARPRPDVVDGADLVEVVRARLVAAGCEDGVLGQIALLLAERITAPEASGVVALARELQRVLDEALLEAELTAETAAAPAPGDGPDDEVAAARRRMEDKLQAVVGDGGES